MLPEIEDAERYCALMEYQLTAVAPGALIGNWVASANNPANLNGVVFSSPQNPITNVTVPAEGIYFFQFESCS